jgi:outer membrane protein assembly factor BamB
MPQLRCRLVLLVLSVLALTAVAFAEDWPRWRGPRGDGSWNAPPLPERWPERGLKRLWRQPVGGGYAGPAVADGRVYLMDREKLPGAKPPARPKQPEDFTGPPDGHERIVCFDADTGRLLWEHKYPTRYGGLGGYNNGPRAMPTVHDGRVYTLGAVGHVHCLDAVTGRVLWAKDMVKEHKSRVPMWGFAASPVIDGERVIVHTGAEPDGCLIAFDRTTGREVWRRLPDPAGYCTPILIDAPGGRQLIAWTPENVHGLDPRTGKRLWTVPYRVTNGVSITTPIFRENIVFVTGYWEGSKAIRLGPGPTDAELLWEDSETLRGVMSQPLYRDGHAYTIDRTKGLVCFELKTGTVRWADHRLTPRSRNPHASLVWAGDGDRVLILNAAGELILARLTPAGYAEQSRTQVIDGKVWSHPAYAGRRLYVRSDGAEQSAAGGPFELVCVELVGNE